eukprot:8252551-Alexandrium_andersonii.AAC.1
MLAGAVAAQAKSLPTQSGCPQLNGSFCCGFLRLPGGLPRPGPLRCVPGWATAPQTPPQKARVAGAVLGVWGAAAP